MSKSKLEDALDKYFKEVPEYEKLSKEISETARMLGYSIFTRADTDETFMTKVVNINDDTALVKPDSIMFPTCLEIRSLLTIIQTSEMDKDEILVNGVLHKLPSEFNLEEFQQKLNKCNELYRILLFKGFRYKVISDNRFKAFASGNTNFCIEFHLGAMDGLEIIHSKPTCSSVSVEDIYTSIIRPSIFEIITSVLFRKKPVTKFILKLDAEYAI